jgi:hypothetical protein
LTFFCELEAEPLKALLDGPLVADLKAMNAKLSLGLRDLSPERAEVVKKLNKAGIPLIAWLLLPKEEGYWFNLRNSAQAIERYIDFRDWTRNNKLTWTAIGLDIEPDMREMEDLKQRNWRTIPVYLMRVFARMELKKGMTAYYRLVSQIHDDGYRIESYQFPLIADERKAHSSILQRVLGLVNLPVDREIWMLYTSFVRPHGAGMLASYAGEAQAIALGSTGGGMDIQFGDFQPLTWDELARDLRLAWYWCDDLYIFSLEGCVNLGYFDQLKQFSWDFPIVLPETGMLRVDGWRRSLQSVLWLISHSMILVSTVLGAFVIWKGLSRLIFQENNKGK